MTTIYHNPRCGKSRNTLKILQERGENPQIIEYLKEPPDADQIRSVLKMLNIPAEDLVRKGEKVYKEKYKGKGMTEEDWVQAMAENPILIERPIVIKNNKAVIGRPPERVIDII